jgi:spore coat assemly protein
MSRLCKLKGMVGMNNLKIGDIVARKSYGGDVHFRITDIVNKNDGTKIYVLSGLLYRIIADSLEGDLVKQNLRRVHQHMQRSLLQAGIRYNRSYPSPARFLYRTGGKPGRILHVDSSGEFMDMCLKFYRQSNIRAIGKIIPESEQPSEVRSLLRNTNSDILILTGHDGIKKDVDKLNSIDNYRNSKYFIQSVKEARLYEPSLDKLCIFAGACQSYYEGIMNAGANFASSPGRILIHALDPGKVGNKVALTDSRYTVTADQIAEITDSGSKGIGGIRTKGHFIAE